MSHKQVILIIIIILDNFFMRDIILDIY